MSRIIRIASGASLAAVTLFLAACSGGSGNTHGASPATSATTSKPSPSASVDTSPVSRGYRESKVRSIGEWMNQGATTRTA